MVELGEAAPGVLAMWAVKDGVDDVARGSIRDVGGAEESWGGTGRVRGRGRLRWKEKKAQMRAPGAEFNEERTCQPVLLPFAKDSDRDCVLMELDELVRAIEALLPFLPGAVEEGLREPTASKGRVSGRKVAIRLNRRTRR